MEVSRISQPIRCIEDLDKKSPATGKPLLYCQFPSGNLNINKHFDEVWVGELNDYPLEFTDFPEECIICNDFSYKKHVGGSGDSMVFQASSRRYFRCEELKQKVPGEPYERKLLVCYTEMIPNLPIIEVGKLRKK